MEEERKKKQGKERELSFSSSPSFSSGDFRNVIWEIGGTRDKLLAAPPATAASVPASVLPRRPFFRPFYSSFSFFLLSLLRINTI